MRTRIAGLCVFCAIGVWAQEYALGPDSQRKPGVPRGAVTHHRWTTSKVFPGTERDYWVYVPAQYNGDKPAAVMIFQDGGGYIKDDGAWRAPLVMDNLIAEGTMPVTIGIFIDPGVLPALSPNQQARYNRSYEYDAISDRWARFVLEEILPEVGKSYKLSSDPNDRGIQGSSSGGIAAFTAAWQRPDAFRRVLCTIGSYTSLRGGDRYANLIRKMEAKPIRVFLQDGNHDLNLFAGDWWMANQTMYSALEYAGYDVRFVTGSEGHNSKHGGAILPDALRWLWRDWPKAIAKPYRIEGERHFVDMILDPKSDWEMVSSGYQFTEGPAVDKEGNVFFVDAPASRIYKVDATSGKTSLFREGTGGASGLMFGGDGRLYAAQGAAKRVVAYSTDGGETVLAEDIAANDIAVSSKGRVYVTEPSKARVWLIEEGKKRVVHDGRIEFANGVRLSPDEGLLLVADTLGRFVWSFQVQPDGSLANEEPFYHLELPDEVSSGPIRSGADGMTLDTEGYLYVATKLGIQICDQPGRVVGILRNPGKRDPSNIVFGGKDLKTLYVTAGDAIYRRRIQRQGFTPWTPVKPPQPRL
jgi:gluconolactonase